MFVHHYVYSTHAYLTGRWSPAAGVVRSPEGRYVLSVVLHEPEKVAEGLALQCLLLIVFIAVGMTVNTVAKIILA